LSPSGPTGQGSPSSGRRGVGKLVASIAVRGYAGDRKDQKTLKKKKVWFKSPEVICKQAISPKAIDNKATCNDKAICVKAISTKMPFSNYSGVRIFYPVRQWEEGGKEKGGSTYKITKKCNICLMICAKGLEKEFRVFGSKYKRVREKVKLVDLGTGGDKPGGILDWVQKSKEKDVYHESSGTYSRWLIPKFSAINKGERLTPKRIEKLKIGASITPEEKDLLIEMLHNREKTLAFCYNPHRYDPNYETSITAKIKPHG
jgi:hypothetical protein